MHEFSSVKVPHLHNIGRATLREYMDGSVQLVQVDVDCDAEINEQVKVTMIGPGRVVTLRGPLDTANGLFNDLSTDVVVEAGVVERVETLPLNHGNSYVGPFAGGPELTWAALVTVLLPDGSRRKYEFGATEKTASWSSSKQTRQVLGSPQDLVACLG